MSFVVYTFRCPACGEEEDRMIRRGGEDIQVCKCLKWPMDRLPSATRTTFKFADSSARKKG